jgi:cholesterol transport system auxiliary component
MRIAHKLSFCSFLILAAFLAGCPNVNKPYPERTYFLFEVPSPSQTLTTMPGTTLDVNRFSISPRSEGREFIYRTTDLEFKSDFYNQFFRPPNNIMTENVRQWLNESGLFHDVLTPVSQAIGNYTIEGNIIDLYGDYRNQAAAKAVMSIQLFLLKISEDGSDPTILLSKTYTSEQPIGIASPQNLMNGWNLALENILGEFLTDVSYHLKSAQQSSNNQSTNNN